MRLVSVLLLVTACSHNDRATSDGQIGCTDPPRGVGVAVAGSGDTRTATVSNGSCDTAFVLRACCGIMLSTHLNEKQGDVFTPLPAPTDTCGCDANPAWQPLAASGASATVMFSPTFLSAKPGFYELVVGMRFGCADGRCDNAATLESTSDVFSFGL
jgi:hypothetical protein